MVDLNHFAISAGLGATLGPRVKVHPGQLGSAELATTLAEVLHSRKEFIADLEPQDNVTRKFEKAVLRAFTTVRDGYSSDRVLADPDLDRKFIRACRNNGLDNNEFQLNLALIGLRKHNKMGGVSRSRRAGVQDQWRYAVASEIAARVIYYRYDVSVDTMLCHPVLAQKFDRLAHQITPGFTPFEYRWAALNMRKKGASVHIPHKELEALPWSKSTRFDTSTQFPAEEGVYTLHEEDNCLFVAGTESIQESIASQHRLTQVKLFPPELWTPRPECLFWRYARMLDSNSTYRWGIVHTLVGELKPVFNIPRGQSKTAA